MLVVRLTLRSMVWATIGTLAATLLIGPVLASGRPSSALAAVHTRKTSCSAYDFHPVDSRLVTVVAEGYLMRGFSDYNSGVSCRPDLPNGAVVTKVEFTYIDTDPGNDLKYCGLFRSDLRAGSAGNYQELAQLPPSGIASYSPVRVADSSIQNATVNQAKFAYWLQCKLEGQGHAVDGVSPDNGLYGATVTYQVTD